ncbi:hypothetical protein [Companilactobacillus furfuricola]|nr:hypothetical protein [Companilactobacillus furfuricola]
MATSEAKSRGIENQTETEIEKVKYQPMIFPKKVDQIGGEVRIDSK